MWSAVIRSALLVALSLGVAVALWDEPRPTTASATSKPAPAAAVPAPKPQKAEPAGIVETGDAVGDLTVLTLLFLSGGDPEEVADVVSNANDDAN